MYRATFPFTANFPFRNFIVREMYLMVISERDINYKIEVVHPGILSTLYMLTIESSDKEVFDSVEDKVIRKMKELNGVS